MSAYTKTNGFGLPSPVVDFGVGAATTLSGFPVHVTTNGTVQGPYEYPFEVAFVSFDAGNVPITGSNAGGWVYVDTIQGAIYRYYVNVI